MGAENSLVAIAEIAAALTGFSGIVVAFGRLKGRSWTTRERDKFADLLNHSGIALFAALTPLVFSNLESGSDPRLWMISSLIWSFFSILGLGFGVKRLWPGIPHDLEWGHLTWLGFLFLLIVQLVNASVWQTAWPYLMALVGNLGFAFIRFLDLVNPRNEDLPE